MCFFWSFREAPVGRGGWEWAEAEKVGPGGWCSMEAPSPLVLTGLSHWLGRGQGAAGRGQRAEGSGQQASPPSGPAGRPLEP